MSGYTVHHVRNHGVMRAPEMFNSWTIAVGYAHIQADTFDEAYGVWHNKRDPHDPDFKPWPIAPALVVEPNN